jgi:hypothetical protein
MDWYPEDEIGLNAGTHRLKHHLRCPRLGGCVGGWGAGGAGGAGAAGAPPHKETGEETLVGVLAGLFLHSSLSRPPGTSPSDTSMSWLPVGWCNLLESSLSAYWLCWVFMDLLVAISAHISNYSWLWQRDCIIHLFFVVSVGSLLFRNNGRTLQMSWKSILCLFGKEMDDESKSCAPHKVCCIYVELRQWTTGEMKSFFGIPMIW